MITHTGSDLPLWEARSLDITVIPDRVLFGIEEFRNMAEITAEEFYEKTTWHAFINGYNSVRQLNDDEKKSIYIFAALHLLRVLSYHAKCRECNQGAVYFMTDYHLNIFFGAYRRLTVLANEKASLSFI